MANLLNQNGFDTGSNYAFGDKLSVDNPPRSAFDLSHLVSTTINNCGVVFPISFFETVPGDDFEISARSLIRVLPQVVPLYSRQRLYIYAFYSRLGDLWSSFNTFITKGYNGNTIKRIPPLSDNNCFGFSDATMSLKVESLGDYLGLPHQLKFDITDVSVSSLPFMMYARIWRDYFCNKNYWINDRVILPDDDAEFRLNDDGKLISAVNNGVQFYFDVFGNESSLGAGYVKGVDGQVFHMGLFYHEYPLDRFTSALPFAQRGETPTAKGSVILTNGWNNVNFMGPVYGGEDGGFSQQSFLAFNSIPISNNDDASPFRSNANVLNVGSRQSIFNTRLNNAIKSGLSGSGEFTLTMDSLRQLAIAQNELEKMARTDGSYAEFGLTFFGEKSKNAIDYRPVYIGGTYVTLEFSEVLQTSQSSGSPLGSYGGHGIGIDRQGYLGKVHCDDFGYIMVLGCVMPDVYYYQGLNKVWSRSLQSDFYLPERSKLGLQPVYNYEVFVSTPNDKGLWAYQDYGDEYRYTSNRICGKIADDTNLTFFPYTQARKFEELPNYSREFALANDVRKDYLATGTAESAYTAQFALDVRAVRPIPYRSSPATMLN